MNIEFNNGKPFFEGVCINDITKYHKTPFYLYSQNEIVQNYNKLKENLRSEIFYAVKANSNQAILKLMKNCGAGADVVSAGELQRSIEIGFDPNKIIFEGVGKSKEDIKLAIKNNIRLINLESIQEIQLVNSIGGEINQTIEIGIRLNPDINAQTLKKISTGEKTDKFGISIDSLNQVISLIKSSNYISLKGISCHIGSQINEIRVFEKVFQKMKNIAENIILSEIKLEHVDLGGGFAVDYKNNQNDLDIKSIGKLASTIFDNKPYKISFEPGRYLVAKAGIIITKILTTKENGGINFLITDAGMQTLIRPAMYDSVHRIEALNKHSDQKNNYTVAGPICESSDIIAKNVNLPVQKIDDYLIIHDTGAYGAVMASNYNSRGLPMEILVNKDNFFIIHQEEKISDIIRRDSIPDWL